MSNMRPPLTNSFALAAQIETDSADEPVDDHAIAEIEPVGVDVLADDDTWPSDVLANEIDMLLTIDPDRSENARLRASAQTAMVEGASRAMARWANTASQPDAVELLMRELASIPDLDDPTIDVSEAEFAENTQPRLRRRAMADELADEIEAILSSTRDPASYDARIFHELIMGAEVDPQLAFDGIRAASQQDNEYRQVIYQGSTAAATCSVTWGRFLGALTRLLGLAG